MPTLDRYVTPVKFPMTIDAFWQFPNLPAYRVEYRQGHAELTYRPRLNMARLRIAPREARTVDGIIIHPLDLLGAHDALAKLFVATFARVPPLDTMPPTTRRHAAASALKHTASGGDGRVFRPACFSAIDRSTGGLLGAVIVTEIGLRADEWPDAAMPALLLDLTWLFVSPEHQRRQIGSALLDCVVNALADQRVPWLASHFSDDNAALMLFHWRHGFELVSWTRR